MKSYLPFVTHPVGSSLFYSVMITSYKVQEVNASVHPCICSRVSSYELLYGF